MWIGLTDIQRSFRVLMGISWAKNEVVFFLSCSFVSSDGNTAGFLVVATASLGQGGDLVSLLPFLVSLFVPILLFFAMNTPVAI